MFQLGPDSHLDDCHDRWSGTCPPLGERPVDGDARGDEGEEGMSFFPLPVLLGVGHDARKHGGAGGYESDPLSFSVGHLYLPSLLATTYPQANYVDVICQQRARAAVPSSGNSITTRHDGFSVCSTRHDHPRSSRRRDLTANLTLS